MSKLVAQEPPHGEEHTWRRDTTAFIPPSTTTTTTTTTNKKQKHQKQQRAFVVCVTSSFLEKGPWGLFAYPNKRGLSYEIEAVFHPSSPRPWRWNSGRRFLRTTLPPQPGPPPPPWRSVRAVGFNIQHSREERGGGRGKCAK